MFLLLPLLSMGSTIGDKVWLDSNQNWEEDAGEIGLSGITVELRNVNSGSVKTTITDSKGHYTFTNVLDEEYSVKVIVPEGYIATSEESKSFWEDTSNNDIDFGLYKGSHTIKSTVWNDKNKNWRYEKNELTLARVRVELYDGKKNKIQTTQSDWKGIYSFKNLKEGEYSVKVIPSKNQKLITSQTLELWLESDRTDINFGLLSSEIINPNPALTLAELKIMIANRDDVTTVNTSEITDMSNLFHGNGFNQDISKWDVSNVINMEQMFRGTAKKPSIFNQDISKWDVSKVENMHGMFSSDSYWHPSPFNQDISKWNVSSVKNMSKMFFRAVKFDQPIAGWNVSNVTDMSDMFSIDVTFRYKGGFNHPIGDWDVSSVQNMRGMFNKNEVFNQNINNWNVSKVKNMQEMFGHTRRFNQPLDDWDVSSVEDMNSMFAYSLFNQPIEKWNVSSVKDMSKMFYWWASTKTNFNQPLGNWDVSSVKSMTDMFGHNNKFNQNLLKWNVSNVLNYKGIFEGAGSMEEKNKPLKFREVK